MKKLVLFFIFLILFSKQTHANERDTKFSLGITTGFSLSNHINEKFFLDVNNRTSDDYSSYNSVPIQGSFTIRTSKRTKFRINIGMEHIFNDETYNGIFNNNWTLSAELGFIFHLKNIPSQFDPYIGIGIGFPNIVWASLGNEFSLNEHLFLRTEILASTFVIANRIEPRITIGIHF